MKYGPIAPKGLPEQDRQLIFLMAEWFKFATAQTTYEH